MKKINITPTEIKNKANEIYKNTISPVIKWRCAKDILNINFNTKELEKSAWIKLLTEEQHEDGSWGFFHGRRHVYNQTHVSTESAVDRIYYALSLPTDHPVVTKAKNFIMDQIINGSNEPLYNQANAEWGKVLSTFYLNNILYLIDNGNEKIHEKIEHLIKIPIICLENLDIKNGVQQCCNEYKVSPKASTLLVEFILGTKLGPIFITFFKSRFTKKMQENYLRYLKNRQEGLGYIGYSLKKNPNRNNPSEMNKFLATLEVISRLPNWQSIAEEQIQWLLDQRNDDGYWDFGKRPKWDSMGISLLPLSENWRTKNERKYDWTLRVLLILNKSLLESHT